MADHDEMLALLRRWLNAYDGVYDASFPLASTRALLLKHEPKCEFCEGGRVGVRELEPVDGMVRQWKHKPCPVCHGGS